MSEYEDLGSYNGDPAHDMMADYTAEQYGVNIGNGNNYRGGEKVHVPLPKDELQSRIDKPAYTLEASKLRRDAIIELIIRKRQSVESMQKRIDCISGPEKIKSYQRRIADTLDSIADLEKLLRDEDQNRRNIQARNIKWLTLLILAGCVALLVYLCI